MNISEIQLDQTMVTVRERLGREQMTGLQHAELINYTDHMLDAMVYELRGMFITEPIATVRKTAEHYHMWAEWESWWQHTKAVHFPTISQWIKRPPRMERHEITLTAVAEGELRAAYPETNIKVPDLGPVRFMVYDSSMERLVEGDPDADR